MRPMIKDDSLDFGISNGDGETRLQSRNISKIESAGLVNELNLVNKAKTGIKDNL